jgi:hypothetical protein
MISNSNILKILKLILLILLMLLLPTNGTLDIIYNQQAALFFGGNFPGVDKIIVLNHKEDRNRYGLLLIQTKNYSEYLLQLY